jgi:agmatine deiminase
VDDARRVLDGLAGARIDLEWAHRCGARRCGPSMRVVPVPIDDSWLRDSGPTFLIGSAGDRAAALFTFNSWGGKFLPYDQDAAVGARVAELAGTPAHRSDLTIEGGGFLTDGEGTLITAETCVLNANRNPGWDKARADAELRAMLGVEKIIWLPGDPTDIATDGHVDGYVAYFKPAGVLCEVVADRADPRFRTTALSSRPRTACRRTRRCKRHCGAHFPAGESCR